MQRKDFGMDRTMQEFLLRAGCAPFVGALGVGFGTLTSMGISGKLVLLTYLLVSLDELSVLWGGGAEVMCWLASDQLLHDRRCRGHTGL